MTIPSELIPDLLDANGFDAILGTNMDQQYAAQLANWGLPIRPAMGAQTRRRQDAFDRILAQNADVNAQRGMLANRQLDVDTRGQDIDLAKNINSSLDPGNDEGMMALMPNQSIIDPDLAGGLDQILGSGDQITRGKTTAETGKLEAETASEPIKAAAAMEAAKNGGASGAGTWEKEFNSAGQLIGFKLKGKGSVGVGAETPTPSEDIFQQGNAPQAEIPSAKVSGRKLIRNSDGSGVIITEDGVKHQVSKENMSKYGL